MHEFTRTGGSHEINKSWWINVFIQRTRWRFMRIMLYSSYLAFQILYKCDTYCSNKVKCV